MPGYDPYLELLGIPPDRRPPSRRELLGVGPDETDVEKIEEATRKRREHLHKYVLSPEEDVAAHARRLLHEVSDALVAVRKLLAAARGHDEAAFPLEEWIPPPVHPRIPESPVSPSPVPVPPPIATVAPGIPAPLEQGAVVGDAAVGDAAAAVAAGASPVPVGEPGFVEVVAPEGGEPLDVGEIAIPLPWKRGLAWAGRLLRQTGELLRRMAAGVRSIPRRLWGIVRWGDGLLRSIAGEENAILHRFLRVVAIALLVLAVAYAGLLALSGLANLRRAGPSPSEVASSPETGTVRIELSDPTAKVQVKVDGNVIGPAALKGPITLAAGRHRLEVTSEEFDDASSFAVRAGTQQVLPVALKPKPPPPAVTGTVRIELSEPQAQVQVKVDGNPADSAKLDEGLVLPAGDHRLEVTSGQSEGYTSSFTVRAGRQEVLRITLTPKLPLGPPLAVAPFDAAQARQHQDSWGRHLGAPVETANSIRMKLVLIPAGEILMGSSDGAPDETPPHTVRITKPFYLGQHEVTVGQFRQFVNQSGYTGAGDSWKTAFPSQSDDHPVVNVSWNDAKAFCDWLSKNEGKEYRLPTEAEWEYACRAGSTSKYCFGDNESVLGEYAWYRANSGSTTHPIGQKRPNAWGLYDVHGNEWEWCADWYDPGYYAQSPRVDPPGAVSGTARVLRGGSWFNSARITRSADRDKDNPDFRFLDYGFRVARSITSTPSSAQPAGSGTLKIELSDPTAKVEVKVDGNVVDSAKLHEPMILPAGDHRLDVTSPGFEDYATLSSVRAGEEQVLRVPLTRKAPVLPVETNSIGMRLVLVPAGEFTMGSSDGRSDEKPPHKVRITKPFYLGQYEVTVRQFRQFVNESGYADAGERWETAFPSQTDAHPVVNVSWDAAKAFCDWLSKKEHREYRLPTEAEWEYACRAGSADKYCFGDDEAVLGEYAWHSGNSGSQTRPVGQKKPNAWGLHDMHGNIWEWCADWYGSDYYASSPADDPQGPSSGAVRVVRGGSWYSVARLSRSAHRASDSPDCLYHNNGFRVVRDVAGQKAQGGAPQGQGSGVKPDLPYPPPLASPPARSRARPGGLGPRPDLASILNRLTLTPEEKVAVETIRAEYANRMNEAAAAIAWTAEQRAAFREALQEATKKGVILGDTRPVLLRPGKPTDKRVEALKNLFELMREQTTKIIAALSDSNKKALEELLRRRGADSPFGPTTP